MIKKNIYIILIINSILWLHCGASKKIQYPIETQNRSISLYKLIDLNHFYNSSLYDSSSNKKLYDNIVLKETDLIYKNLLSELRRCAKFGLYQVVDSTDPHEISIKIEFLPSTVVEDSLLLPFKAITTDLTTKQKEEILYNYKAFIPSYNYKDNKSALYIAGRTLLSYRKFFPYEKIIKRYYHFLSK